MITLALATVVAAPRAVVWSALTDPEQIARWRPGVEASLAAAEPLPAAGRRLRFRCRLQGVLVTLEETALEVSPEERLRSEVRFGLFRCEESFALAAADPDGGHTRVSLRITAPSETPLLGASLDRFAVRRFATDLAGTCLRALRDWCELGQAPAPPLPATEGARAALANRGEPG